MTNETAHRAVVPESLGLNRNPVITGLWQVADLERDGSVLDRLVAADELLQYVEEGFTCFDMADHYGSAELIAGAARAQLASQGSGTPGITLMTKWCPHPLQCDPDAVRRGIDERCTRLGVETIDLLQLHWWSFDHPGYIDVMDTLMLLQEEGRIQHIGLTNFDTDHLEVLRSCAHAFTTNQVCLSVLDQRALGNMSEFCLQAGVHLLAYGTLAGGFLSDKWLDVPEPATVGDWSKMKYQRFIQATGGWDRFQSVLHTLNEIAARHRVSLSNVASRWVLEQAAVSGIIVGARLLETQHRQDNKALLTFALTEEDHEQIREVSQPLSPIKGDCGSEYRRPPYLTASGDLSHHLDSLPPVYQKQEVQGYPGRWRIDSKSEYEGICGYSRGVRDGNRILISGTTATHGADRIIGLYSPQAQTVYILDKISASLAALGGTLNDVVRTRIYMEDASQWEIVSRVHGRYFADILPANSLIEVSRLVGDYAVEIEAEAIVR